MGLEIILIIIQISFILNYELHFYQYVISILYFNYVFLVILHKNIINLFNNFNFRFHIFQIAFNTDSYIFYFIHI
jgi:hypothetical protein